LFLESSGDGGPQPNKDRGAKGLFPPLLALSALRHNVNNVWRKSAAYTSLG